MKTIQLQWHQMEAITAIQEALDKNQKQIVVEMIAASGKGLVLAKTVELLHRKKAAKILVVTSCVMLKENMEHNLFNKYQNFVLIDRDRITVTTEHQILHHINEKLYEYQFIIFDEVNVSESNYVALGCKEKTIIVFSRKYAEYSHRFLTSNDIVFSYGYKEAVNDGLLTPAMDSLAFEPAVEAFIKQLLEQFGYSQANYNADDNDYRWDLIVSNPNRRIWVECKTYKSQVVSPSAANSLLQSVIMQKTKQNIPPTDIILLVVLSKIPSFQKDEIFKRFHIIVWDIENLVFYSKNDLNLLKQLSQITYYPIDHIEGQPSAEVESIQLLLPPTEDIYVHDAEKEALETNELIQHLANCKPGKKHSGEFEEVCEKILRTLFEANYFNKLRNQYKTKDEHFRMDLIGSLKINQNNEESMHPLWQMLVQHYNSHFVVFEFKNYSKEIDQNLIYITEKYLFDAALRNVAIIVSRKGFSKSAKFAAEGCLKEHGKLILDINDNDLIKMLELKSDKAADYVLDKLEDFLMGISK